LVHLTVVYDLIKGFEKFRQYRDKTQKLARIVLITPEQLL